MASPAAKKRLMKEQISMESDPPPFAYAKPDEMNILIWHFVFLGPPSTSYENGEYHGVLDFPNNYPFAPPKIKFITPNGRFLTNTSICTSFSEFHKDTWNPMLSVSTILTSLLSFFCEDAIGTGGTKTSDEERRKLASESRSFNRDKFKNKKFNQVFHENLYPNDDKKSLEEILADSTKPKVPIDIQNNENKKAVPCENNQTSSSKEKSDPNSFNKDNEDKIEEYKKHESIDDIQISMEKSSLSESRPKPKRGSAMSRFREKVKNSTQN